MYPCFEDMPKSIHCCMDLESRSRLNCIKYLFSVIPYEEVPSEIVTMPKRELIIDSDTLAIDPANCIPEMY